jgi:nitrite reductase/ring-hydroxylating ferredoxin subunit
MLSPKLFRTCVVQEFHHALKAKGRFQSTNATAIQRRSRIIFGSTIPATKAPFSTTSRIMAEFKVKGLSKLDLAVGEKREVELEGVEDGMVLLVNVNGKVSALGNKCTHYGNNAPFTLPTVYEMLIDVLGGPLVNGVLTGDGRLTCPWHGGELDHSTYTMHEFC